jgi:demethylmenaquinone methyltransferase/2-methoxy-6-polyprenyl-1,4-benzoquinol methylase
VSATADPRRSVGPVRTWDRDELPTGDDKVRAVREMFDAVAPRYDRVNRLMTFRMDVGWRRRSVRALGLGPGSSVLDLAAGTGDLCIDLARAGLHPFSVDMSLGMLRMDRSGAPRVQADALALPFPTASVDGVTCGFALRNFADLGRFFAEVGRVVRPGGRIALLDVATPANPVLRAGHAFYFGKVVPRVGAIVGSDAAAYRYLPRSVAYLPAPAAMMAQLEAAGFPGARRELLSAGITQLLTGTRA